MGLSVSKKTTNNIGFTLIEIILAMGILAATMVPVFYFMSKGAQETDINASRSFAINRASEILDSMLENVPFQALRIGIPAFIRVDDLTSVNNYDKYTEDWAKKFANTVFPGSVKRPEGWPCQCIIEDPRGMKYKITLRVNEYQSPPGAANQKPELLKIGSDYPNKKPIDFSDYPTKELTFAYLKNPIRLLSVGWHKTVYLPNPLGQLPKTGEYRFETELAKEVSENPENFYTDAGYAKISANSPRFTKPIATRFTQRLAGTKVGYAKDTYCSLKHLIIEVRWHTDGKNMKKPDMDGPGLRKIHIMTFKADLHG